MSLDEGEITRLLHEADAGQEGALDKVMDIVYQDLSGMAESHLRRRYGADLAGVTLEPSALVHETFLRLIRQRSGFGSRRCAAIAQPSNRVHALSWPNPWPKRWDTPMCFRATSSQPHYVASKAPLN